MPLDKKTTLLFPDDLYRHLSRIARERGVSVGKLVRDACMAEYGPRSVEDRASAAAELARLELPVSTPGQMKRESVPDPDSIVS